MRTSCRCLAFAVPLALAVFPLIAGDDMATSAAFNFWMDTGARPKILASQSAVDSFAARRITYRAGETVTVVKPDGTRVELVSVAASGGSAPFALTSDGLWRFENSNGAVVLAGVSWGVMGDNWACASTMDSPFRMYTKGQGPDRRGLARIFPDVAYSGDHWRGDSAAASTLTFIAPDGSSSSVDLEGSGARQFTFNPSGRWIVRLAMADGTAQEAVVNVTGRIVVSFR